MDTYAGLNRAHPCAGVHPTARVARGASQVGTDAGFGEAQPCAAVHPPTITRQPERRLPDGDASLGLHPQGVAGLSGIRLVEGIEVGDDLVAAELVRRVRVDRE